MLVLKGSGLCSGEACGWIDEAEKEEDVGEREGKEVGDEVGSASDDDADEDDDDDEAVEGASPDNNNDDEDDDDDDSEDNDVAMLC